MAHILIVDDEAGIREFIADVLEDDGHETTQAEDALAALHHVRDELADPRLVVHDQDARHAAP